MDLLGAINRSGKSETILKTLVWNSVKEVFLEQTKHDITPYLVSISVRKNTYVVKTNKPVINTQAYQIVETIKARAKEKLKKIGVKVSDFEIKFI